MQPYANTMFNGGVIAVGAGDMVSTAPLVEGDLSRVDGVTPVETPASGFANSAAADALGRDFTHDILVSSHGIGAAAYISLKKDSPEWPNAMAQVRRGHELAIASNKGSRVRAIAVIHGETDVGRTLSSSTDSVQAVVRGGAKGATSAADVTSTVVDGNRRVDSRADGPDYARSRSVRRARLRRGVPAHLREGRDAGR